MKSKLTKLFAMKKKKKSNEPKMEKRTYMSINDLIAMQSEGSEFMRFDTVVRYLAIKDYYGENSGKVSGLALYRKMQDLRRGEGYSVKAEEAFIELMNSYEKTGYNSNSCICLDKNLKLLDGSHRLALCIYHKIKTVSVMIIDEEVPTKDYSLDWFFENGFTHEEIRLLQKTAKEIVENHKIEFTGIIWAPAVALQKDILEDIELFGNVADVKRFSYSKAGYENIVRKIYAEDEIATWKIDSKLEHMKKLPGELIAFHISFDTPRYRIERASNLPISKQVERVKKHIQNKYKEHIKDYMYDYIIHIADNGFQSFYIDNILKPDIDMNSILIEINKYKYVIMKTEVPYFPDTFPDSIPVGKNIDILCTQTDYIIMLKSLYNCVRQRCCYEIRIIREKHKTRIRYEIGGRLLIQFDVAYALPTVSASFVRNALANRIEKNGYYILNSSDEYLLRMTEFAKDQSKRYHLLYLRLHRGDYNEEYAVKSLDKSIIETYGRKLEQLGKL